MKLVHGCLLLLTSCLCGSRAGLLRASKDVAEVVAHDYASTALQLKVGDMVQTMLSSKSARTTIRHIADVLHRKMRLSDALPQLEGKLPKDVMTLVASASQGKHAAAGKFSEVALEKARIYLNNMMYDAWLQLDQVDIDCKEFEESNREVFSQVVLDLDHIGSELADKYRMKVEAESGMQELDARFREAKETLHKLKREYNTMRQKNSYELKLRQDDQEVFTAILQLSKCKNEFPDNTYSLAQLEICDLDNGTEIHFVGDSPLTSKVKQSERVQQAILAILDSESVSDTRRGPVLSVEVRGEAPTLVQMDQSPPVVEVKKSTGSWKKCRNPTVNCGLLHDTMALQWGRFKDSVDELTYIMEQNHDAFESERDNLNEQLGTFRNTKTTYQEILGEAVSNINALEATTRSKQQQHHDIERAYKTMMGDCKKRITEILFTNLCGVRIVRNTLMRYSEVSPTQMIVDCDITDWSSGPCTIDGRGSSLTVDCDDSCPVDVGGVDVQACGGVKLLTRQVIVSPNNFGMACPPLYFERKNGTKGMKCNQFKCPVNCVMSQWSGWSSCSKECGGGTQGKTRSILSKNKNGGTACESTIEERSCHTGSCDRDCTLMQWTEWEPCSTACGGGMQKRVRKVDVPIRANGKCPKTDHADRLEWRQCNTHDCVGDEVCVARQDLVLALDASGSLRLEGFELLRTFAANLTSRYQSVYYGVEEMNMGLLLFGNGEYFDNGSVSPAIELAPLTSDLHRVKTAIEAAAWQRGFTNMMQAMSLGDKMFEDGRSDAQSCLMILSDGKYTNAYRTGQKATAMKDKGIQIFIVAVSRESDSIKTLRQWTSTPHEANFIRIAAFERLHKNEDRFAQLVLVEFCPRAFSPSQQREVDEQLGYLKIKEEGLPADSCATWVYMGRVESADACFEAVKSAGMCPQGYPYAYFTNNAMCCKHNQERQTDGQGAPCDGSALHDGDVHSMCCKDDEHFACAVPPCIDYQESRSMAFAFEDGGRRHGTCYAESIEVTDDLWAQALNDQVNVSCPGGAWEFSYYASTYIMNPSLFGDLEDASATSDAD